MNVKNINEYLDRYRGILKYINEDEFSSLGDTGAQPDMGGANPAQSGATGGQPSAGGMDSGMQDSMGQEQPVMGGETEQPAQPQPAAQTPPMDVADNGGSDAFKKETEIDVTDLVDKQSEIKKAVDNFSNKMEYLMQKLSDLDGKVKNMDSIANKIDMVKRDIENIKPPTPQERMEMISMDSYPFNQTLDDYWSNKKSNLEKYRDGQRKEQETFETNTKELEDSYNEPEIKKSFDPDEDYDGTSNPFKKFK